MRMVMKNEDEIREYAYERNIPYTVDIELLTACNLKCKHCYIPHHDDMGLTMLQIKSIFMQLKELGTMNITLTGGEIFCREDIFDIILLAREMGFRVTLFTNATLLDEKKIKRIKELVVYEVSISLYSLEKQVYEGITGVKGSFDKLMENIDLMEKYKIRLELKMPVMKDNQDSYEAVLDFCEKKHIPLNANAAIFCKTNGDKTPCKLQVEGKKLIELVHEIDEYKKKSERFSRENQITEDTYVCSSLRTCLGIDCKGNIYPCSSFQFLLGNINTDRISDILLSKKYQNLKNMRYRDLQDCLSCEILSFCDRCPGLALFEDDSLVGCSDLAKLIAEARFSYGKEAVE